MEEESEGGTIAAGSEEFSMDEGGSEEEDGSVLGERDGSCGADCLALGDKDSSMEGDRLIQDGSSVTCR
jgi:hypothetical protein